MTRDKEQRIGLWLTKGEKDLVRRLAAAEDRSMSYIVKALLNEALRARGIEA